MTSIRPEMEGTGASVPQAEDHFYLDKLRYKSKCPRVPRGGAFLFAIIVIVILQ